MTRPLFRNALLVFSSMQALRPLPGAICNELDQWLKSCPTPNSYLSRLPRELIGELLLWAADKHDPTPIKIANRLAKDLQKLSATPPAEFFAAPLRADCVRFLVAIPGPLQTPFEGGVFLFEFTLHQYPLKPPHGAFITKVYHPCVREDGRTWLPHQGPLWTPVHDLRAYSQPFVELLSKAPLLPDLSASSDIAALYESDRVQYIATAQQWTREHAMF